MTQAPHKDNESLREQIVAELNRGDEFAAVSIDKYGDVFDALSGEYGSTILSKRQLDNLVQFIAAHDKAVERQARIYGAIMGAKFGNAAFRQYNIANPTQPIDLDTVRQMGIEQATEWARRQ